MEQAIWYVEVRPCRFAKEKVLFCRQTVVIINVKEALWFYGQQFKEENSILHGYYWRRLVAPDMDVLALG